jgi:hypothetical protein
VKKHPKVITLSSKKFLKYEIKVLEKGMKFTPTPERNDKELELDGKMFCRKLRLNEFFKGNSLKSYDNDIHPIVKNKSNFTPYNANSETLEKTIECITKLSSACVNNENNDTKSSNSNFSKKEWKFIKNLQNDNTLTIKEADKGSSLVIMDSDYYKEKNLNILTYQTAYKKEFDLTEDKIITKIKKFISNYSLLKDEEKFITNFEPKASHFYGAPKVHKSKIIIDNIEKMNTTYLEIIRPHDLTFRLIAAGHSSSTSRISHFIDELLKPFLQNIQSYIKDSFDFLKKLPKSVSENAMLVTFDVVGLYANIRHDLGIKAIEYWLHRFPEMKPERICNNFILEGINIILTNNLVRFNEQNYIQIKGVAMGTRMAPTYAALTLAFLEEQFLYPKIESATYFKVNYDRFLDD